MNRSLLINISVSLATIIIFWGIAEGVGRVLVNRQYCQHYYDYDGVLPRSLYRLVEESNLIYDLIPNAREVLYGKEIRINSYGMRDEETTTKKPENTFRIAVLGDSVTFGYGVSKEESYPDILEKKLRDNAVGDKKIEVLNFGVMGYGMNQNLFVLEHKIFDFEPDVIILGHHLNDIWDEGTVIIAPPLFIRFLNSHSSLFSCLNRKGALGALVLSVTDESENKPLKEMYRANTTTGENSASWNEYKKTFEKISQISKEKETPVMIVLLPVWNELNDDYEFKSIHEELDRTIRDVGLYSLNLAPSESVWYEDAMGYRISPKDTDHPNVKGHAKIANAIYDKLTAEKLLPE